MNRQDKFFKTPHQFLGSKLDTITTYCPNKDKCVVDIGGEKLSMMHKHDSLFEISFNNPIASQYKIELPSGMWIHDPYSFPLTLEESDFELFLEGKDYALYDKLGAHIMEVEGVEGVRFTVWAPNAKGVFLACDWNHFSDVLWPMSQLAHCGVWEIFIPGAQVGFMYKYAICNEEGHTQFRADPFAQSSEIRPQTASIVSDVDDFEWEDHEWIRFRKGVNLQQSAMNIYEVHLGSWKRKDDRFMNYRDIAIELANYCKEMGYTHVELMPITEHPLDESWGYQVTGYFAATSRFGTPQDFQFFMNHLHKEGLFVILDWVGGHFPTDFFALAQFDGSHLFEYEDEQKGFHPQWNTLIFDYRKPQVSNFLIASVLFWADKMHLDGFRFDAVSSILYLSFARKKGEWTPNKKGGAENLEAIKFLKHMNQVVHERHPGICMIAEEATVFPGVSHKVEEGGLGFDFKSNLGWMNDSLRYFQTGFDFRHTQYDLIMFYMMYAYNEHYVLFLSHDEVVHEKRSLISKMPGSQEQQFANAKLLYIMMMTLPGKKLIFMGGEFGQWNEWNEGEQIHWHLLEFPAHQGMQRCVKTINHFYIKHDALWLNDYKREGFEWVLSSDSANSVIAYLRHGSEKSILVIHNFSQNRYLDYTLKLENYTASVELFNSECEEYMGSGDINESLSQEGNQLTLCLAPFVTTILEVSKW
ncbi:MAG: 1,4-alpha-glucan branching protein GlgB [Rhabdochlamydiaceae bacterium]|nr:1,4-alpha-glucan branching protein GlgB [Candidatus Amphrikana amoebophyrae]